MIFLNDGAGEEFLQARLICCGIALIDPFQIRTPLNPLSQLVGIRTVNYFFLNGHNTVIFCTNRILFFSC
jgi:hypothetical protein